MSIRMRLTLWYGTLFGLVLLLTYALHARSHYDDLDHALVASAGHAAAESASAGEASGGPEVAIRRYRRDGTLREAMPTGADLPVVDPRAVLAAPAGPAFDPVTGLLPSLKPITTASGAFGLVRTPAGRWRLVVLPVGQPAAPTSYVEAIAPLERLDASMRLFRFVPLGLGLAGLLGALLGGWAIAGGVRRPVATMMAAAAGIAGTRDFSRRIVTPLHRDERHGMADTLNAMPDRLEAADRAQHHIVADASHEPQAPLTALQGTLQPLHRHREMLATEGAGAPAEAEREAARLMQQVGDRLAPQRGAPIRPRQPVELDRVLLEVLAQARHLARGQRLVVAPLEPIVGGGDRNRLRQLLLIVFDNALKSTPRDGRVVASLRRGGGAAEVRVRDTNIGIPAADLPQAVEGFHRVDLALARWIAEQHGGEITLTSGAGRGTLVTIWLPAAAYGGPIGSVAGGGRQPPARGRGEA